MKIDVNQLRQLAGIALPLVRQFGGSNPMVAQLAGIVGGLLGEDPQTAPVKQEIDAALKDSIAARRKASSEAREELKWKPSG